MDISQERTPEGGCVHLDELDDSRDELAAGALSVDERPLRGWMTDNTGTENRCVFCPPPPPPRNAGQPSNCLTSEIERFSGGADASSDEAARSSGGCIEWTRREKNFRERHDEDEAFAGGSSSVCNEIVGMFMLSKVAGEGGGGADTVDVASSVGATTRCQRAALMATNKVDLQMVIWPSCSCPSSPTFSKTTLGCSATGGAGGGGGSETADTAGDTGLVSTSSKNEPSFFGAGSGIRMMGTSGTSSREGDVASEAARSDRRRTLLLRLREWIE